MCAHIHTCEQEVPISQLKLGASCIWRPYGAPYGRPLGDPSGAPGGAPHGVPHGAPYVDWIDIWSSIQRPCRVGKGRPN